MQNLIKTTISVDPIVWENANRIFKSYGISANDAINMFLCEVESRKDIPIEIIDTPKEKVLNDLKEAVKEVNEYLEGKRELIDARELLNEL